MVRNFNRYDLLKCIAIILVVIGHITILYNANKHPEINTSFLEAITTAIYLFHMPLFMAVSGSIYEIGYKRGKYREFVPFIKNKIYRLLIPYLCVGLLFLLPTLVLINDDLAFNQIELYSKILFAHGNKHLWFLLALFWIFIFQFIADRLRIRKWILFFFALALSYVKSFGLGFDFMCFTMALHYWPYFILGTLIENYDKTHRPLTIPAICVIGVIICGGGKYLLDIFWIDAALHILCPCFIIILFDMGARWLIKYIKENKWLTILLDNSFAIYLFHVSVIFLIHHYSNYISAYILILLMLLCGVLIPIGIANLLRLLRLQFIIGEKYK